MRLKRNRLLVAALLALAAAGAGAEPLPEVVMHKDPNCGCCGQWAEYLQANGFRVKTVMEGDMQSVKRRFAVPQRLTSCHTAKVGGYVIEGHVPASAIKRLLREKPAVAACRCRACRSARPAWKCRGRRMPTTSLLSTRPARSAVFESHR